MAFPLGQGSYVGMAQQVGPTGWGGTLVATGLKTFPNLGGDVLSPVAGRAARKSITTTMVRSSHTYRTVDLVNIGFNFEVVADPTAFKPLLLWAWGKRTFTGAGPYVDTFQLTNPAFDFAADSTPSFYNHSASIHVFLSPSGTSVAGSRFSVKDAICTQFEWSGEANGATVASFQGTGRNLAASASTVAFTDQGGSVLSWEKAASAILLDTADPPATVWKLRSFRFTLAQPHTFETGLGGATGTEMYTPFRTSPPTATLAFENFFADDASGTDPAQNMADFISSTGQGVIVKYAVTATDYWQVRCSGAVDPVFLNNPKVGWSNNGAVSFGGDMQMFPDAQPGDLEMTLGTTSGT